MAGPAAVNVFSTNVSSNNVSRHELLAWVNRTIGFNYSKVEEMCSGAAYCKLIEKLFPATIPLKKVKMQTKLEHEYINNLKILQTAFTKLSIKKVIPIERMAKARFQDNFEFLQWFHKFYMANVGVCQATTQAEAPAKSAAAKRSGTPPIPKSNTFLTKSESEARSSSDAKPTFLSLKASEAADGYNSPDDSSGKKVYPKTPHVRKTKKYFTLTLESEPQETQQTPAVNDKGNEGQENGAEGDKLQSLVRQRTMTMGNEDKEVKKLPKDSTFVADADEPSIVKLPTAQERKENSTNVGRLPTSLKYMFEKEPEQPRPAPNQAMELITLDEDEEFFDSNSFTLEYGATGETKDVEPEERGKRL